MHNLERLLKKGLRALFKDNCSSYDELLNKTLYNRRLQDIGTLMFKVKYCICPTYISDLFTNKAIITPWGILILLFPASTRWRIEGTLWCVWCRLPRDIRNVTNLNHFKKLIRRKDLSTLVSNECGSVCRSLKDIIF